MNKFTTEEFLTMERAISEALCKLGGHTINRVCPKTGNRLASGVSVGGLIVVPHLIATEIDANLSKAKA